MIVDKLTNIEKYKSLSPNFKTAIEKLQNLKVEELIPWRNEVDGDNVYLINVTREGLHENEAIYEYHEVYADLHFVTEEYESFYYEDYRNLVNVITPFSKKDDIALFKLDSKRIRLNLKRGEFVIFFPGEAHAHAILGEKREMKKIVLKVKC